MKKILLPLLGILFIINGCASISASKNAQKRSELDAMAAVQSHSCSYSTLIYNLKLKMHQVIWLPT